MTVCIDLTLTGSRPEKSVCKNQLNNKPLCTDFVDNGKWHASTLTIKLYAIKYRKKGNYIITNPGNTVT